MPIAPKCAAPTSLFDTAMNGASMWRIAWEGSGTSRAMASLVLTAALPAPPPRRRSPALTLRTPTRLFVALLSLCFLALSSVAMSSPLPSPSNMTAVSQCVSVPSRTPWLVSLTYQSALLSASAATSPPISLPSYSSSTGWTGSSPLLPVSCVLSSLPSPSSTLELYENVGGLRGAAIVSTPHTLPSLDVWVLGWTSSAADQFSFYVQSSLGRSAAGEVVVNVSSVYQPPSLPPSQSVTLATFANSLAYFPVSSYIRLSSQSASAASTSALFTFPSLPSAGVLYAVPASVAGKLPSLAPLLPAVDPFNPLSFTLPSLLPSGAVSDVLSSQLSPWQIPLNVSVIAADSATVLVYRSNATSPASNADSFQVWVDDGQSTMPGAPLTVNVQLLTEDAVVLSAPATLGFVVPAYGSGHLTLPCMQSAAPATQCHISLLTLPETGQVSTNGVVINRVPYPLANNSLVFAPTNNNITDVESATVTYVAYNGVAVSPVYTLAVSIHPAPAPPSCTSFTVESADYAEVLVRLTAAALYANSSYEAVITSLPNSAVGSLVTSDERTAVSSVPFTLTFSDSPQLIFSPNVAASGSISSSTTAFTYYVVDQSSQLACPTSTVTVVIGTTPPAPFVPVTPLIVQTTQVDPIVVTLSTNSAQLAPITANITSLPYNGTLYQYQTLPAHWLYPGISVLLASLLTDSASWSSADSPSSYLSANSSYTQLYNNVSAVVQSACLTSAAVSCLPPSVLSELTPITAATSVVLDPLLRLLYVPARSAVADSFAYTVSASAWSASASASSSPNTGWVSVQIQSTNSPPSPLPPVASSTSPLSVYLPALGPFQLPMYQDDELFIDLQADAGYSAASSTGATLSFFVSRLPVNGTLYYQNVSCGGCWTALPALYSAVINESQPFEAGWQLKYVPTAGQAGAFGVNYLYASFDFFVVDSVLGSCPPASVALFVLPPLVWPSCVSPSVQALRGTELVIALGNWVDQSLSVIVHSLPVHGLLYQSAADGKADGLIWRRDTLLSDSLLKLVYVPYVNLSLPFAFDVFTYGVYNSSTQLLSPPCSVNVSLTTVQPIPTATPLIFNTTENNYVNLTLSCSVPPCIYSLVSLPAAGELSELFSAGNVTNSTAITNVGLLPGSGQLQFSPLDYDSGDPINYNYYANFSYIALPADSPPESYSSVSSPPWSLPATVTLQVSQVNYAPMFADQNLTVLGDSYIVISLAANNTKSQPAAAYTVTIASLPARGSLYQYTAQDPTSPMGNLMGTGSDQTMQVQELDANGDLDSGTNVVFVPVEFEHGVNYANFSFFATDETQSNGKPPTYFVNINVTPRNHAPVASPLTFTIDGINGNQMVPIDMQGAATDVDGNEIFYSVTSWPTKGVLWSCERLPAQNAFVAGSQEELSSANAGCEPDADSIIQPYDLSPVAIVNISNFTDSSSGVVSSNSSAAGNVTLSLNVTAVTAYLLSDSAPRNLINSSLHFSLDNSAAFYPFLNFTYTAFDAYLANTSSFITILLHCPPGSSPNIWQSSGPPCIGCPTGAQCSTDGTYPPYPMPGYWPMLTDGLAVGKGGDMVFELCHPASACLGGVLASCGTGYQGKLCGSCQPDFVRMDVQCVQCPSAFLFFTAVTVGACVLFFVLAVLLLSKHRLSFSSSFIVLSFFQTVSLYNNYDLRWPNSVSSLFTAVSLASFNVDLFAVQCYIPYAAYPHKWVGTILLLPVVMALMVVVWAGWLAVQWMGMRLVLWRGVRRSDRPLLPSSASVAASWVVFQAVAQSSVTHLLRYQTIWLLSAFLPLLAKACQMFECAQLPDGTVQFYPDSSLQCTQNWHVTLVPFAILFIVVYSLFLAIWLAGGISKHVPRGVHWSGWCWSAKPSLAHSQQRVITNSSSSARSMHAMRVGMMEKMVEVEFAPTEKTGAVHDSWPSVASPTSSAPFHLLSLSSPTSSQSLSFPASASAASAAAAASAFPSSSVLTANPASATVSTYSSRRAGAAVDHIDASFAFLTSPFKPIYFYWYLIIALRLLLLAVTCLLYPDIPIVGATMALLVLLGSALLQCVLAPYRSSSLNRLELVCLLTAAFVLFCGVIFKGDTTASMSTSALSDLFIVFVFVALSLAIAFASFVYWRKVERLLYCRRCRRVPTLRVKSAEVVLKLGRTARERVQDRRDLAPVRSRKVDKQTQERERAEMVRAATAQQLYMDELHKQQDRLHNRQQQQQRGTEQKRDEAYNRPDDVKTAGLSAASIVAGRPSAGADPFAALSASVVLLPASAPLRAAVSDPCSPLSSAFALSSDSASICSGDSDTGPAQPLPALFVISGNSRQPAVSIAATPARLDRSAATPSSRHSLLSASSVSRPLEFEADSDESCLSQRSVSSASCAEP